MSTAEEHRREAEATLTLSGQAPPEFAALLVAQAQVHATLALAMYQRQTSETLIEIRTVLTERLTR